MTGDVEVYYYEASMGTEYPMNTAERRYFVELVEDSLDTATPHAATVDNKAAASHTFISQGHDEPIADSPAFIANKKSHNLHSCTTDRGAQLEIDLDQPLGQGRYAHVYQAILDRNILVAVKVCNNDPESVELGRMEMEKLSKVYNKNFLLDTVTSSVVSSNHHSFLVAFALVLDYAIGGSLADLVFKTDYEADTKRILRYAKDLFAILERIHSMGMMHLDIKPQNLLLKREDILILADFGSAVYANDEGPDRPPLTLCYAAPELLSATDTFKPLPASDIYSAGATLYSLLTGRPPFADFGRSGVRTCIAIKQGFHIHNPISSSSSSNSSSRSDYKTIASIIHDCTQLDPSKRPNASTILTQLSKQIY